MVDTTRLPVGSELRAGAGRRRPEPRVDRAEVHPQDRFLLHRRCGDDVVAGVVAQGGGALRVSYRRAGLGAGDCSAAALLSGAIKGEGAKHSCPGEARGLTPRARQDEEDGIWGLEMKVMADNSIPSEVVTRTGADAAVKAVRRQRAPVKAGQVIIWIALMGASALTLFPISQYAKQEVEIWKLLQANDAGVREAITGDWMHSASADYVEAISELSLNLPKADTASAYAAALRATELDGSRAHAWATLAWLEYSKAKKVTPAVLDALTK